MKRLLFIAMDIGNSAPGIVFSKLLRQIVPKAECSVICSRVNNISIKKEYSPRYKSLSFRVEDFLLTVLGTNIIDGIWSRQVVRSLNQKRLMDYDCIVSLVSSGNYAPILVGERLSKEWRIPWVIYTVDAIPSPSAWNGKPHQNKAVASFLRSRVNRASGLFAANPMMLSYLKTVFYGFKGASGIVYTPRDQVDSQPIKIRHDGFVFLYTGNVYGIRKIDTLLKAFCSFLASYPDSKLIFVGNIFSNALSQYDNLIESGSIQIHPFTADLTSYFSNADVLIDIGAALNDDVFLSSKIVNYLAYKMPILAITQDGSPARSIFKDIDTIIHCHHDADEIRLAMSKSISLIHSSYDDRDKYLNLFSAEVVANGFVENIMKLL